MIDLPIRYRFDLPMVLAEIIRRIEVDMSVSSDCRIGIAPFEDPILEPFEPFMFFVLQLQFLNDYLNEYLEPVILLRWCGKKFVNLFSVASSNFLC